MATVEPTPTFRVSPSAQEAIGSAIARHPTPAVVRLRILPGTPPTVQMYLVQPRFGEEVLEFGPARLVLDPESRSYMDGGTIDYHPPSSPSAPGSFSVEGPRLRPLDRTGAASEPSRIQGSVDPREAPLLEALHRVYDPEIPINIVDLGLIYGIEWPAKDKVLVRMTVTSPGCPVAGMLEGEVKRVAVGIPGIRDAEVRIVWEPPWGPEKMSEAARRRFGYA